MSGSRREIGGYFELERFSGEPYHKGAIALNSGRACLEYLIELRGIHFIWLPDWLCASVLNACLKHNVEVRTYRIGADMKPVYDFVVSPGEYFYLVDYYGQLDASDVQKALFQCEGRLVVDEAQGFFRAPWKDADTIYTCRKFFGVADGGYLYIRDGSRINRDLETDESHAHMGFVLGRFERPAGEFYSEANANNARFADEPVKLMSPITENILSAIDYAKIRHQREENFMVLHNCLSEQNLLDVRMTEGPYMYPLLLGDTKGVRESLIEAGIFIPVLWPGISNTISTVSVAVRYSKEILPLPVDQRYGPEDMERITEEVAKCLH